MKKNLLILLVAVLPALGQSTNRTGIPPEATIFKITFDSGRSPVDQEVIFGAIKISGEFLKDKYPEDDSDIPNNFFILLDDPANPGEINVRKDILRSVQPEAPAFRAERYKRDGFVEVESHDGKPMLVQEKTRERKKHLDKLRQSQAEQEREALADYENVVTESDPETGGPGFLALWWPHAAIVAVAALALFGLARLSF